jgi:uncharacterized protein
VSDADLGLLRELYDALGTGRLEAVLGLLTEGVKAHVPGRSLVSGEYIGRDAVAGYVGKLVELSGGTLRFEPHDVVAGEDHGIGLVKDLAERGDRKLAMNNVHVWHFGDGGLDEIWVYPGDQYAWDEFWS